MYWPSHGVPAPINSHCCSPQHLSIRTPALPPTDTSAVGAGREGWQAKRGRRQAKECGREKNILGVIFHTGFTTFPRKFNLAVLFLFANQNQFNFKTTRRANGGKNILQWLFAPTWNGEHSLTRSAPAAATPAPGELTRWHGKPLAGRERGTRWRR